jgi:Fe-S oxidoreductase
MCVHECPARVNIPKLMLEAKAANVAEHGIRRSDWLFTRLQGIQRLGSGYALLSNALLRSRWARWLFEKLFGLSKKRRLPRFAYRNFFRLAKRRGWMQKPDASKPRLAYFVDSYAAYNDPQIAAAAVAVLQHQGFAVYVPPGQQPSGAAAFAHGDVESAREIADRNIHIMADLIREGFRIVCSEPTAAVMFQQDYLDLIDDRDGRLVADNTVELTTLLHELHAQGKLRTDFQPLTLSIGHHVPCHIKALGKPAAGPELLRLIPDLSVHTIDVSCSGMAGVYGLKVGNYETSLDAGRPMLAELARPGVLFGSTECSSCRLQMEDAGGKRTLHPVEYLALAYGLMPEIARRLEEPIRELVLR